MQVRKEGFSRVANRNLYDHLNMTIPAELKLRIGQIANERDMSISALCRLLIREEIVRYETDRQNRESGNRRNS